jgi:NAD(P)-dependent dehydrogenase (short-subunit alcohol dehydrogenase family)
MTTTQKIAFITGAGRGIGLETARGLGSKGVHVVLGVRKQAQGEAALEALRSEGISADLLAFELAEAGDHQKAFNFLTEQFGRLDILINNAGIYLEAESTSKPVTTTAATLDINTLRTIFEVNFFSTVLLTQKLLPLIEKSLSGRIVNVSSIKGSLTLNADPESVIYNMKAFGYDASKTALNAFTIQLAHALKDTNIKVNTIHPGWVRSAMGGSSADIDEKEGSETSIYYALIDENGPSGGFYFKDEVLPW